MALDQVSANDKVRIKQYLDGAIKVLQEVQDLKDGLKDTTKALAEELDIKPAILNKAARVAFKANFEEQSDEMTTIETILEATGHR